MHCGLLYGIFKGLFDEAHMPHILTETALSLSVFLFLFHFIPFESVAKVNKAIEQRQATLASYCVLLHPIA